MNVTPQSENEEKKMKEELIAIAESGTLENATAESSSEKKNEVSSFSSLVLSGALLWI